MLNHELRRQGISGSDLGPLFGCDDERDEFSLWLEKKEGFESFKPSIRMVVGKALEPGILTLYTYVTGREVEYCDETRRHPSRPWMIYTPDALCMGEQRGVDAKLVFWDQRRKWGDTADEIPDRVQLQCRWYMAALDYDVWDVAALVGEGEPRIYTIERHREVERIILARAEEWYRRYLVGNEQPPIGGSDASARWLKATFPHHKRPDMREATPEEIAVLNDYTALRLLLKELDPERDKLENRLKFAIGEKEGLTWPAGRFTWRRTKDTQVVDWHSMAIALLYHHIQDEGKRAELLAEYTHTKPGYRRIRLDADALRDGNKDEAAA